MKSFGQRSSMILSAMLAASFIFGIAVYAQPPTTQPPATFPPQEPAGRKRAPVEEQEPEIKGRTQLSVDVSLVSVDISVTDKKGNLITGLGRENFDIYEDGVKQEIQNFSTIEAPITVVMLIEFSRMVDAEVAVADGETAVLGGLMREGLNRSGTGVPVLRSVPLVGVLFGKREHSDDEEELVVLVTPRLLPP